MPPQKKKTEYRMGGMEIVDLLFIAAFVDALTLIPFVGNFFGPVFWFLFSFIYVWLIRHWGFMNVGRLVTSLVSTICEILPGFQALPSIVLGMLIIIILMRVEDKTGLKLTGKDMASNIKNIKSVAPQIKNTGKALAKYAGQQVGQRVGGAVGRKIGGDYGDAIGRGVGGSLGGKAIASRTGHPVQRKSSEPPPLPQEPPPLPTRNESSA